jgi:shikimate kinase
MVDFIKKKFEVEDPDVRQVRHKGERVREMFDLGRSNIFFVGLRGSGKTTLARHVARELQGEFKDTDMLVAERAGQTIADLVKVRGWEAFRSLEHEVLAEVCASKGQVVATGGGIVLRADNRELLKKCGQVFYLMATPPLLAARLSAEPSDHRPGLTGLPLEQELSQTLQEREPLYFDSLHFILQADNPVQDLVRSVMTSLGLQSRSEQAPQG